MRKFLIFFSIGLSVASVVLYMYNTTAAALTDDDNEPEEPQTPTPMATQEESTPKKTGGARKSSGKSGKPKGPQTAGINKGQDPDMHSAANSKSTSSTQESTTGNVD